MNKKYEIVTRVIETNNDDQSLHWVVQQHSWDDLDGKIAEKVWVKGLLDEVIEYNYYRNDDVKFTISTSTVENDSVGKLLKSAIDFSNGRYRSDYISGWGEEYVEFINYLSREVKRISVSNEEYKKVTELRKKHPNTSYYNLFKKVLSEKNKKAC